jgi:hypothetical protein
MKLGSLPHVILPITPPRQVSVNTTLYTLLPLAASA